MTHGYFGLVDGIARPWRQLIRSGDTVMMAVSTDWVFGTTPVVPPVSGGGWWKKPTRRWWEEDDEEWLLL